MTETGAALSASFPSIDCLMVTMSVPERLPLVRQSIDDFCAQTWPNRELLILVDLVESTSHQALLAYVEALARPDIRFLPLQERVALGAMRNRSVAAATGTLICQWDDDDRHHPQRLEKQAAFLIGNDLDAVYLQDVMQFFPSRGAMFWTNWRATPAAGHPGTLMARRAAMPAYPENQRLGEDLAVARHFVERGCAGAVAGLGYLYVYVSHGANSWSDDHHAMLSKTLAISQALLRRRERELRAGLLPYDLRAGVTLWGTNGEGFVL